MQLGIGEKDRYVGDEAQSMRGMLKLKYPFSHGIINDWDTMEIIWHHAFYNELREHPSEHPVLLSEMPGNPLSAREKSAELMFEQFEAPAFFIANQAVLALWASGRTTGCVVNIGDGDAHVVPVYEGYTMPHAILKSQVGGWEVTNRLALLLREAGYNFTTSAEVEAARYMKELLCFVSNDLEKDISCSDTHEKVWEVASGEEVRFSAPRFLAPEILFQPHLIGRECPGIHQLVFNSIMKCDIDIRRTMFENLLLAGGTTMLPGLQERLKTETATLANSNINLGISAPPERKYSSWVRPKR